MQPEDIRRRVKARLEEQRNLVQSLLQLREQLHGSLFVRYGECGKETCVCRQGLKHGPYYVLSTHQGRGGRFAYLEKSQAEKARRLVARYREFRSGLARLKKLNLEVVALLRRYQQRIAREGDQRLGLHATR